MDVQIAKMMFRQVGQTLFRLAELWVEDWAVFLRPASGALKG